MPKFLAWQSYYLTSVAWVIRHNVAANTDLETEKKSLYIVRTIVLNRTFMSFWLPADL